MSERSVWYVVADLTNPAAEPFYDATKQPLAYLYFEDEIVRRQSGGYVRRVRAHG